MDPNLVQWKCQGQSFLRRLRMWVSLLDPALLLSSDAEILKAHTLLGSGQKLDEKDNAAVNLSLSSLHADSGAALPLVFRPPAAPVSRCRPKCRPSSPLLPSSKHRNRRSCRQVPSDCEPTSRTTFVNAKTRLKLGSQDAAGAFLPISGPLVVATLLPHSNVKPALFWQFLLQSYNTGFNYANRNSSAEQGKTASLRQLLLIAGTISYTAVAGALPQIFINRLHVRSPPLQTFCRSILPIPLSAALAFLNVFTVRSEETETGIQVFDSNGMPVGISKAAAEKAVRETAFSRAALFGLTATVPNLLVLLLRRTRFFQKNSMLVAPCRHISVALVLGLMIPVSFSLFPQLGTIKRENLEEELQAGPVGSQLFYHRGL